MNTEREESHTQAKAAAGNLLVGGLTFSFVSSDAVTDLPERQRRRPLPDQPPGPHAAEPLGLSSGGAVAAAERQAPVGAKSHTLESLL